MCILSVQLKKKEKKIGGMIFSTYRFIHLFILALLSSTDLSLEIVGQISQIIEKLVFIPVRVLVGCLLVSMQIKRQKKKKKKRTPQRIRNILVEHRSFSLVAYTNYAFVFFFPSPLLTLHAISHHERDHNCPGLTLCW